MDSKFDVICFGDINVDYIGRMERIPDIDEELPINNLEKFCGGAATNVAVALSRLGKKTGYIGSIGNDSNGIELLARLRDEGVDVSRVNKKENYSSTSNISLKTFETLSPESIDSNGSLRKR